MTDKPPTLSPAMLLWEVGAILARHGIPYSTDNPSAALTCAERLLRSLGLTPEATAPPAELPSGAPAGRGPLIDATAHLPVYTGEHGLPPRRPTDRFSIGRTRLDVIPGGAS